MWNPWGDVESNVILGLYDVYQFPLPLSRSHETLPNALILCLIEFGNLSLNSKLCACPWVRGNCCRRPMYIISSIQVKA